MNSGEKAAIGVAVAVVAAAGGYELWKKYGGPPKTASVAVTNGSTVNVKLSKDGGALTISAPIGAVGVLAIPSTGTTSTAGYTINGVVNADQFTTGTNTLSLTWLGGAATVNVAVS